MSNDNGSERQDDRVLNDAVHWDFGLDGMLSGETVWRCDALRAGKLYSRSMFGTRKEADAFAVKMREAEPDQMFSVESIKASTVWN